MRRQNLTTICSKLLQNRHFFILIWEEDDIPHFDDSFVGDDDASSLVEQVKTTISIIFASDHISQTCPLRCPHHLLTPAVESNQRLRNFRPHTGWVWNQHKANKQKSQCCKKGHSYWYHASHRTMTRYWKWRQLISDRGRTKTGAVPKFTMYKDYLDQHTGLYHAGSKE